MINLITAIGNPYINEKIKKNKNYNVISKDIQYKEGILEILHINKNIEILLISTIILEEKEFIEKIKKEFEDLEIIVFVDKKFEIDLPYLNSKGIYKIYSNNNKGYDEYLKNLDYFQINITEQVKNDMKNLKNEILKQKNKKIEKNIFFVNKKQKKTLFSETIVQKTLMVSGARGVGKSVFLSIFSKYLERKNKSVLILDIFEENSFRNIIFEKCIEEKNKNYSKKINYMIYKDCNKQNNYLNSKNMIEKLKINYDVILIDNNFEKNSFSYKDIAKISDDIVFLIEPNLTELQKAKRILEIYKYDFEISNEKIKIIFNKVNEFSISKDILKELFEEYKILEYINYNPYYNLYINKNTKYEIEDDAFESIYTKLFSS